MPLERKKLQIDPNKKKPLPGRVAHIINKYFPYTTFDKYKKCIEYVLTVFYGISHMSEQEIMESEYNLELCTPIMMMEIYRQIPNLSLQKYKEVYPYLHIMQQELKKRKYDTGETFWELLLKEENVEKYIANAPQTSQEIIDETLKKLEISPEQSQNYVNNLLFGTRIQKIKKGTNMITPSNREQMEQFASSSQYVDFPTYISSLTDILNQFETLFRTDNTGLLSENMKGIIATMMVLYSHVFKLTLNELQTPGLYQKLEHIYNILSQISDDDKGGLWNETRQIIIKAYHTPIDHHHITTLWAMPLTENIQNKKIISKDVFSSVAGLTEHQSNILATTGFPPETDPLLYAFGIQKLKEHQLDILVSSDIPTKRKDFIKYIQNIRGNGPKKPWWQREYLKTRNSDDGTETYMHPLEFIGILQELRPHQTNILKYLPNKPLPNGITIAQFMQVLKSTSLKINEIQQATDIHFEDDTNPEITQFIIDILADVAHVKLENRMKFIAIDDKGSVLPDAQGEADYRTMPDLCNRTFAAYPTCKIIIKGDLDAETMKKHEVNFSYLDHIIVDGNFVCCPTDLRFPDRVTNILDLSKLQKPSKDKTSTLSTITNKTIFPYAKVINFGYCLASLDVLIIEKNTKENATETDTILPIGTEKIIIEPARLRRGTRDFDIASMLLTIRPGLEIFDTNGKKFSTELPKKIEPVQQKPIEPKPAIKIVEQKIHGQHFDYDDLVNILIKKPEFANLNKKELKRLVKNVSNSYKDLKTETRLRDGKEVTCITTTQTEEEKKTETITETIIKKVCQYIVDILRTNDKREEKRQQRQQAKTVPVSKQTENTDKKPTKETQQPIKIKKYISIDLYDEIEKYSPHKIDEVLHNISEINLNPFDMNRYGMRYTGPITIIKDGKEKTAKWIEKRPGACLVQSLYGPLASNDKRIVWSIGKNKKGELIIVCTDFCKTHNEQYINARENASVKDRVYKEQELEEYIDIDEWLKTNANINKMQTLLINPTPQKNR